MKLYWSDWLINKSVFKALDLDFWQVQDYSLFSTFPQDIVAVTKEKSDFIDNVDILCICPKVWQNNQSLNDLLIQFLKGIFNKSNIEVIFEEKNDNLSDMILKYNSYYIVNFTQNTCQDNFEMIKIDAHKFELLLEKPQLKKRVMLDVFRNPVFISGNR